MKETAMATLKNICTFFQNLNEYVYASDIETNELVYLNHKAMDAFGVKNTDEIRGRKCYEVLPPSHVGCVRTASSPQVPSWSGATITRCSVGTCC